MPAVFFRASLAGIELFLADVAGPIAAVVGVIVAFAGLYAVLRFFGRAPRIGDGSAK